MRKKRTLLEQNLCVEISDRQMLCKLDPEGIKKILFAVLKNEDYTVQDIIVSLSFVTDKEIQSINKEYLSRDYYTDVISFSLADEVPDPEHPILLGEIIVSTERASQNAKEYGTLLAEEIKLYIIHGILHLLGYNDIDSEEKNIMTKRENELQEMLKNISPIL